MICRYDGQAGAAALTLSSSSHDSFMRSLYPSLRKSGLPDYAIPRLVRITEEIETNATFKKSKVGLLKRSWKDAERDDRDKLYWLNGKTYESLDGRWDVVD